MIKKGLVKEVFKNVCFVKEVFKNVCFVRSIKKRTEGRRAEIYPFTNQNYKVKLG